ncbi:hypothetical protein C8054_16435 [Micromonospora sp. RP3T]|nr:hypothetical protein C8054_16435 [Micromonospora sp. RP3T]
MNPTPTARRAPTSPPARGPAGRAAPRPASTTPPVTVSAGPAPPRATATAGPSAVAPADGLVVQVMSRASGLPVGVRGGSTSDGASVVQRATAGAATRWRLVSAGSGCYQLANGSSGKALDLTDGSHADGTPMQQWTLGPGNINQTWCFHSVGGGWYSIRSAASGALLDLRDGGAGDGVTIQQWGADPTAPNAHQTWQLLPAV